VKKKEEKQKTKKKEKKTNFEPLHEPSTFHGWTHCREEQRIVQKGR